MSREDGTKIFYAVRPFDRRCDQVAELSENGNEKADEDDRYE